MPLLGRAARALCTAALVSCVAIFGVAACAAPVVIDPAPYAADPQCASVMLGIPEVVGEECLDPLSSRGRLEAGGERLDLVARHVQYRAGVFEAGP